MVKIGYEDLIHQSAFQSLSSRMRVFFNKNNKVFAFTERLVFSGVTADMSYYESRRIMINNIAGLAGGTCAMFFFFSNLINGYILLCGLDLVAIVSGWSMPFFMKKGWNKYPPVIAILAFSSVCTLSSFFYHNFTEYFLLLFMGVCFVIYNNIFIAISLGLLNAGLFIFLQLNKRPPLILEVSEGNKAAVLIICLSIIICFLVIFKAIYRQYIEKIESQNAEMQRLNNYRERVMTVVSHDIRSPIANLSAVLTLLKQGVLSKEDFQFLSDQLLNQVNSLDSSITSLLLWSKNQLRNPQPKPVDFNIVDVIKEVTSFLEFQSDAKQIQIELSTPNDLQVWADRDQVEIILRNLLSNAIKFSYPNTRIVLTVAHTDEHVEISVRDYGKGIPQGQLIQIFAPDELISTLGTNNEKGIGLGLKLSRDFAKTNGGDLQLESYEGEGTRGALLLPLVP